MNLIPTVFLLLVTLLISAPILAAEDDSSPEPRTIHAAGCVERGIEAGCLVLKDSKTSTAYNLFFAGTSPQPHTAISFDGTLHSGKTICMEGTAVDVTKWEPIRIECPQKPSPPKRQ